MIKVSGTMIYSGWQGPVCHRIEKCIILLLTLLLSHFLSSVWDIPMMLSLHGTLIVVGKAFMSCQSGPKTDAWLALVQQGI